MEIRFVDAFLEAGLSLKKIRRAAQLATELVGTDHPFSTRKFHTDGKRVFAEIENEDPSGKALYDLEGRQFGIYDVILPSLIEGVEFGEDGQAISWQPNPSTPLVIIDPRRQFGQPIIRDAGLQTAVLADAVRAEGSVDAVASYYEVQPEAVKQAVKFEFKKAA